MEQSQSREIHVTFKEHKRLVPVRDDTYKALLDGFISTFNDVFLVGGEEVRETVLFQKYDPNFEDFVDIKPDESTAGKQKIRAVLADQSPFGTSYPLMNNNIYNLWSFGSYQGNSFLRPFNDQTLSADGDGKTDECEWLAHKVDDSYTTIYWKFSNVANNKVLAVNNGQVVLLDSGKAGRKSHFLPSLNGRYQCFSPRDKQGNFLATDGDGSVKLILNKEAHPATKLYNPHPQTFFIPYFLRTKERSPNKQV